LASLYPRRSLALLVGVVACLMLLATGHEERPAVEECPFEQTWFQGDMHFSQELTFEHEGTGVWSTGGMDSDAPHKRLAFRWRRDRETLTAEAGGESRTVRYEITRHNLHCFLRFAGRFLPDEGQKTSWRDSP
jgi:hypothetical protein